MVLTHSNVKTVAGRISCIRVYNNTFKWYLSITWISYPASVTTFNAINLWPADNYLLLTKSLAKWNRNELIQLLFSYSFKVQNVYLEWIVWFKPIYLAIQYNESKPTSYYQVFKGMMVISSWLWTNLKFSLKELRYQNLYLLYYHSHLWSHLH